MPWQAGGTGSYIFTSIELYYILCSEISLFEPYDIPLQTLRRNRKLTYSTYRMLANQSRLLHIYLSINLAK